jgi:hypothetical protein
VAHIPNPWDNRWVQGKMTALYAGCTASKPSAHIMISRELTLPIPTQKEVTLEVLQSEQSLQEDLQQSATPTWLQLFQASLQLMKLTTSISVIDYFLCASLQRPLLAAVPINASSSIKASPDLQNSSCTLPLPSVPLWAPDSTQVPLSTHTCYTPLFTSQSNFSLSCHINVMVTAQLASPLELYFWYHNTLHSCITQTTPGPCIQVIIVPQLTLCGEAEFSLLCGAQPKHTALYGGYKFGNLRCRHRLHGRSSWP